MSTQEQFIGRSEKLFAQLVQNPFGIKKILSQVPIMRLIKEDDLKLDEEIKKHKFDFVIWQNNGDILAVEINYHHGTKADKKSNDIFAPTLQRNGIKLWRIDDYECDYLFKQNSKKIHTKTTDDIRDILNSYDLAGLTL